MCQRIYLLVLLNMFYAVRIMPLFNNYICALAFFFLSKRRMNLQSNCTTITTGLYPAVCFGFYKTIRSSRGLHMIPTWETV